MKPSSLHYLLAKSWPWILLFWGVPLLFIAAFADEAYLHHASIFLESLFGAAVGLVIVFGLLYPLQRYWGRHNGGPFSIGAEVTVLRGTHRDCTGRVHQVWHQTRHVRVRLDEQLPSEEDKVFSFLEVFETRRPA